MTKFVFGFVSVELTINVLRINDFAPNVFIATLADVKS